jgi:hypothetical protein
VKRGSRPIAAPVREARQALFRFLASASLFALVGCRPGSPDDIDIRLQLRHALELNSEFSRRFVDTIREFPDLALQPEKLRA